MTGFGFFDLIGILPFDSSADGGSGTGVVVRFELVAEPGSDFGEFDDVDSGVVAFWENESKSKGERENVSRGRVRRDGEGEVWRKKREQDLPRL